MAKAICAQSSGRNAVKLEYVLNASCIDRMMTQSAGQSAVAMFADYLARTTRRQTVLDVDGASRLRVAGAEAVIVHQTSVAEIHRSDPSLQLLADCYQRGAIIITELTDRRRDRPDSSSGAPAGAIDECCARLESAGLPAFVSGYARAAGTEVGSKIIVVVHDPICRSAMAAGRAIPRPLAIMAAYNEADIVEEVAMDLLEQDCDLIIIDNWSVDATGDIIQALVRRFPDRIQAELFPSSEPSYFAWGDILRRKEELALQYPGRWIVHVDADEIRRFPRPGVNLRQGFGIAQSYGANRVDFRVLNFLPIGPRPYQGPLSTALTHFEFGRHPAHRVQRKAWLQGQQRVDLAESGGHTADFFDAVDFPYRWLLRHYPLRSPQHGRRKVLEERKPRWSPYERTVLGWHNHYDEFDETSTFIWDAASLHEWDDATFCARHSLSVVSEFFL